MALSDPQICVHLREGGDAGVVSVDARFQAISTLLEQGFRVAYGGSSEVPSAASDRPNPVVAVVETAPGTSSLSFPEQALRAAEAARERTGSPKPGGWLPWFPVIDYDRCTNCMQCLSFCLFGVYGVDTAGKIQAQHQDNCKTNCPACSRVCPEAAIMFPKYKSGPINGDTVSDSDLQREKMKIDISALLGGDVYALLRDRSERARSRFGKERDADKALAERQKCLTKLGEIMADVPAEVLASLPSPEQIAKRAEEAKARAQQALSGI